MEIGKEQIKEYLEKYNIKNKEDLVTHIEELKRNTIPNTKLISELVYVLEDDYFFRAPHTIEDFLSFPRLKNKGEKSTWEFLKPMFEEVHVHKQTVNGVESYSKPLYEEPDVYEDTKNAVEPYISKLKNKDEEQENVVYDYTLGHTASSEVVNWVNKKTGKEEKIRIFRDPFISNYAYHRPPFVLLELDKKPKAYKETEGKLFYELDWGFITQMAERMASNKKEGKYELWNWKKPMTPKGIEDLKQASMRHLLCIMNGEYEDDERPFGHLEALADNMMMINYQLKIK